MQLCIIDMYVVTLTKLRIVENTGHARLLLELCIILNNVPVTTADVKIHNNSTMVLMNKSV